MASNLWFPQSLVGTLVAPRRSDIDLKWNSLEIATTRCLLQTKSATSSSQKICLPALHATCQLCFTSWTDIKLQKPVLHLLSHRLHVQISHRKLLALESWKNRKKHDIPTITALWRSTGHHFVPCSTSSAVYIKHALCSMTFDVFTCRNAPNCSNWTGFGIPEADSQRDIEPFLGLAMWVTQLFPGMRPLLQYFYADLFSASASLYSIKSGVGEPCQPPASLRQVLVSQLGDLFQFATNQWQRNQIYLMDCQRKVFGCAFWPDVSPAEVCVPGSTMQMGGFVEDHEQYFWLSEQFEVNDFQQLGLPMRFEAQKDIACYETLAHMGLLYIQNVFPTK